MTSQLPNRPELPDLHKRLPELFVQLLAEMAFADSWSLGSPEELDVAMRAAETACCVPFSGDRTGLVVVCADEATLTDLAAGYHSLPDEMVDDGTRLEFLAEAGTLLVREIGAVPGAEIHLVPGAPRLPGRGEVAGFAADARCVSTGFGCNGNGWLVVVVRFDD